MSFSSQATDWHAQIGNCPPYPLLSSGSRCCGIGTRALNPHVSASSTLLTTGSGGTTTFPLCRLSGGFGVRVIGFSPPASSRLTYDTDLPARSAKVSTSAINSSSVSGGQLVTNFSSNSPSTCTGDDQSPEYGTDLAKTPCAASMIESSPESASCSSETGIGLGRFFKGWGLSGLSASARLPALSLIIEHPPLIEMRSYSKA